MLLVWILRLGILWNISFSAGFKSLSVLVQRPQMAPVRCGFWRAAPGSPQAEPPQPLSPPQTQPASGDSQAQPKPASNTPTSMGTPSEGSGSLSLEASPGSYALARGSSDGKPPKHRPAPVSLANCPSGPVSFVADPLLAAVEPHGAQVLELHKLEGFRGRIGYSPTRNRQFHMYTITERPDARSAPLKRVFLR